MKKLLFLLIALVAVLALVGCGGGSNNGTDNNTNGNGNGNGNTTASDQWAAYNFAQNVDPASGGSGKIKTFTVDSVYSEDGKAREFKIEGTYLGTETAQIVTQKMVITTSPYGMTTENVTTAVECYKVKHHITVVKDETGDTHPAWADTTIWIPTGALKTTAQYFWIYPKATYEDSDGHKGEWSYYLTQAMQTEMSNPPAGKTISYAAYTDGEFYGYDEYAFFGLYGYGWMWFQGFAKGGTQTFQTGTWGGSASGYGVTYTGAKVDKTIGGYTFHAWSIKVSWTGGGATGGYEAVFSDDLALPVYWKIGATSSGSSDYWQYTLTDLKLG